VNAEPAPAANEAEQSTDRKAREEVAKPTQQETVAPLISLELAAFLARSIPPRAALLAPIILEQTLNMVHAWRGAGKTHFALGIAYAVASGGKFLRWQAPDPQRVLYVDLLSGLESRRKKTPAKTT